MEAGKRKIEDIFNKGRVLEIPFFQRSYVWDEENWERLLEDMQKVIEKENQYFLGPVILKSRTVPSDKKIGDLRIVIDGQQRLTTLAILFKALCEVQGNTKMFEDIFYNRAGEIILKHNHNDIEIFEAILSQQLSKDLTEKYKDNKILKCYQYFLNKKNVLKVINADKLLNLLCFVGIDLGQEEDEQQIFDTLNSLGVLLTTAELLKNEMFRREEEELYKKTWKETFEKDEPARTFWDHEITSGRQHRANIDLFLQAFLIIQSNANDKYLMLSSLFANYKLFLKEHNLKKQELVKRLVEFAGVYRNNIDSNLLDEDIDSDSAIERLNIIVFGLNTTTVVPYILFVLKEVDDDKEREGIFRLLEAYLVRRLICKVTTKNYNNLFASFIRNKVNRLSSLKDLIYNSKDQTNVFPNNVALKDGFEASNLTNQQAKTVLYLVEKFIRSSKDSTNLLSFNEYSVEHIMPTAWRNRWGSLDEEKAEKRDQTLKKLGNLTIITTALNSSIRDADWDTKKNGQGKNKGLIEYCTGIKTFSKYLKEKEWNEDLIDKRGQELYQHALKIWQY